MIANKKEWFRQAAGYEFVSQYVNYGTSEYFKICRANDYERRLYPEAVQRAEAENRAEAEHRSVMHARDCMMTDTCPGTERPRVPLLRVQNRGYYAS